LRPDGGRRKAAEGWFEISTLRSRFAWKQEDMDTRLRTLNWELPDAFLSHGAAWMIGMWKAFDEMEQLG